MRWSCSEEKLWSWFSHNTELFFKPCVNARQGAACHKISCLMYFSKSRFKAFQIFVSGSSEEPRPCRNGTTPVHSKNNALLCSRGCPEVMSCVWSRWKLILWGNRSCAPSNSNNLFADVEFKWCWNILYIHKNCIGLSGKQKLKRQAKSREN